VPPQADAEVEGRGPLGGQEFRREHGAPQPPKTSQKEATADLRKALDGILDAFH
jgi:hypothetical protein